MRHNNLLLSILLILSVFSSCATTDTTDEAAIPEESAQSGKELSEENMPAMSIEEGEPDTAEDEIPESAPAPEEPEAALAPVKEARRGGRKPLPREEAVETDVQTPAEAVETKTLEETAPAAPENEEAQSAGSPDEAPVKKDLIGDLPAEQPARTEEPVSEAIRKADLPDEQKDDYSITIVNELAMDDAPSHLPSERDEIDYNPLLPVVVDAPSVTGSPDSEKDADETAEPAEAEILDEAAATTTPPAGPASPAADKPAEASSESTIDTGNSEREGSGISELETNELQDLRVDGTGKLIIALEGSGWIYLSSDGDETLTLKDKSYDPDSGTTRFVFSSSSLTGPEGKLVFLKQDLLRGESIRKSLDLDGRLGDSPTGLSSDELKATRNTGKESDDSPRPDTGDSAPEASGPTPSDFSEPDASSVSEAPSSKEEKLADDAAGLLRLAREYEAAGPGQSLEKALELYYRIKTQFPVTEERFIAETRIRYLNKHYFKVQ